jgi:hypothetical protein
MKLPRFPQGNEWRLEKPSRAAAMLAEKLHCTMYSEESEEMQQADSATRSRFI